MVAVALLLGPLSACAPQRVPAELVNLPRDRGVDARYLAKRDALEDTVRLVLRRTGFSVTKPAEPAGALFARRGRGATLRVVVRAIGDDVAGLLVASDRKSAGTWQMNRPDVANLIAAIDVLMGANRVVAFEGVRVQGRLPSGVFIEGGVITSERGPLFVPRGTGTTAIPFDSLREAQVFRGGHDRAQGLTAVGIALGLTAGIAMLVTDCRRNPNAVFPEPECGPMGRKAGHVIFGLPLVGFAIGALLKTERWSPIGQAAAHVGHGARPEAPPEPGCLTCPAPERSFELNSGRGRHCDCGKR